MYLLLAYAFPDRKSKNKTTNSNSDTESFEEISESDLLELQAHKSPISDTSDTLTYGSLTSNVDEDTNGKTTDLTAGDVEKQQKCMSEFLEKYVLGKSSWSMDWIIFI